jgi:hypothetical protein
VSQQLLWLWHGDSSGTQEEEHPPLEACTRGLVKDSRLRGLSAYIVNCGVSEIELSLHHSAVIISNLES